MRYKIGVDGGASKTECILVDAAGKIVARRRTGGCNPNAIGADEARRVLTEALRSLPAKGTITATLLCMAGSRPFWREFARGLRGFGRVRAVDDSLPVLELATQGEPGLVLHAGTGSFVAARTGKAGPGRLGAVHYAGGVGWRLGDPGSGYDLGRRAIAAALLEMQGWRPPSRLTPLVRRHTRLKDVAKITRTFYTVSGADPRVPGLVPGLLRLAERGDASAVAVVAASTANLLELAVRVAAKLFPGRAPGSIRAGLSGPILNHPGVLPMLRTRSPLHLAPISGRPIEGVRRLLAYL